MQLEIFEGRGAIHKQSTLELLKKIRLLNAVFADSQMEEIMWEVYRYGSF